MSSKAAKLIFNISKCKCFFFFLLHFTFFLIIYVKNSLIFVFLHKISQNYSYITRQTYMLS